MRRALLFASVITSALLLLSCQKNQAPQLPTAAIADSKSCFSLAPDLGLWDISGASPTQKGAVQIGEKLSLLGQARHVMLGGKDREFLLIRQDTGAEGWVRADYVVSNAILAVTTTDAVVYSAPRNTAATTASIPRMTTVAIHSDSGGMPFIRISYSDPGQKGLLSAVYLRNEGVSARPDDVQAAILLQLAADSKSPRQQEAFLTSGIKDYPASLFLPQLQDALDALHGPPTQPAPTQAQPQESPSSSAQSGSGGQASSSQTQGSPAAAPSQSPAQPSTPASPGQAASSGTSHQ